MQALIDAAVMIVAMVVPTLRREFLKEGVHVPVLIAICRLLETPSTRFVASAQYRRAFAKADEGKVAERRYRPALEQVGRGRMLGPVFKALPLELRAPT